MKGMRILFVSVFLTFYAGCMAFPGKVEYKAHTFLNQRMPVNIVFTGFEKYPKEEEEIRKEFIASGFKQDTNASLLLEVVLEELEPRYKRKMLHTFHLILSIGTLTIFPYHNQTEHRLMIKLRENGVVKQEVTMLTKFHQWRGILLIPMTYFYWPSTEFTSFLKKCILDVLGGKNES